MSIALRIFKSFEQTQITSTREGRFEGKGNTPFGEGVDFAEVTVLPARMAAVSGENGDIPCAIKSALTKFVQFARLGRTSRAKVVLPAPFGSSDDIEAP